MITIDNLYLEKKKRNYNLEILRVSLETPSLIYCDDIYHYVRSSKFSTKYYYYVLYLARLTVHTATVVYTRTERIKYHLNHLQYFFLFRKLLILRFRT